MTEPGGDLDGALVVDKPPGVTSHDVVAVVRRTLGRPKVGHTGTLDPAATGVLPLLIGRATRLSQFLTLERKAYDAGVRLGWATTTYDAEGMALEAPDAPLPEAELVDAALSRFRGPHLQTPPPVSAKKVGGRRAYALARSAQPVALPPVPVEVFELERLWVEGPLVRLRVECSAGFYVRALAHDLGAALGTDAHLASLRRTRSGPFGLEGALTLEQIAGADVDALRRRTVPMAALLPQLPELRLTDAGARRVGHGHAAGPADLMTGDGTRLATVQAGDRVRLVDQAGRLVAVAEARLPALHPLVVLG